MSGAREVPLSHIIATGDEPIRYYVVEQSDDGKRWDLAHDPDRLRFHSTTAAETWSSDFAANYNVTTRVRPIRGAEWWEVAS